MFPTEPSLWYAHYTPFVWWRVKIISNSISKRANFTGILITCTSLIPTSHSTLNNFNLHDSRRLQKLEFVQFSLIHFLSSLQLRQCWLFNILAVLTSACRNLSAIVLAEATNSEITSLCLNNLKYFHGWKDISVMKIKCYHQQKFSDVGVRSQKVPWVNQSFQSIQHNSKNTLQYCFYFLLTKIYRTSVVSPGKP